MKVIRTIPATGLLSLRIFFSIFSYSLLFFFRSNPSYIVQVPDDGRFGRGISLSKRSVIRDLPSLGETQQVACLSSNIGPDR